MVDDLKYQNMYSDLMRLSIKDLKEICRLEGICPGYTSSRKHTLVCEIVSQRRYRELYNG